MMEELFRKLEGINDPRQSWKVKHRLADIIGVVFFAMLGDANDWMEIQLFAQMNEDLLRTYMELPNGIPSHDTIQRVMGLIEPEVLRQFQETWNDMINRGEGEKIRKIINLDGKTMRGSGNVNRAPLHVLSAWSKEDGLCLGQRAVNAKENEIVAIPGLLDRLQIKGHVVTIDAMGTQKDIAEKIATKKGDYVLSLKANHPNLYDDVQDYLMDTDFQEKIRSVGAYKRTVEKARSQIEIREYFQTDDIGWLTQKVEWRKLTSIGMVRTTIRKGGAKSVECRFFISSLAPDIELFAKAVRGHWAIESMHWQLDVTFREDHNTTLDKRAALNMNSMRKFCLAVLKLVDIGVKTSLKGKRKALGWNPVKFIAMVMAL